MKYIKLFEDHDIARHIFNTIETEFDHSAILINATNNSITCSMSMRAETLKTLPSYKKLSEIPLKIRKEINKHKKEIASLYSNTDILTLMDIYHIEDNFKQISLESR